MIFTVALITIFVFAILGVPLFIVMALLSMTAFFHAQVDTSAVAIEIYKLAQSPTLQTIPLFTFAGYLMSESKTPLRLLRVANAILGWMPGGVAIVCLSVCAFFTAFTGASGVTIIALGGLLLPILMNKGYNEKFSLGLLTTSGSLGLLFAPSLPIILYGLVAKVDIDILFKAGMIPGVLLVVVLSLWALRKDFGNSKSERQKFSLNELIQSIRGCYLELMLPAFLLIGIYGGLTTVTEAAAVTALYILIIEFFVYRDLNLFKDLPRIIVDSMSLIGAILLILGCALGVTNYLVDEEVPTAIFNFMRNYIDNKYTFLFCLNIFLLIVGCLMDIFSAIIVVVPLITPIAHEFGVHPVHLAIIFLTNLEIGYITPPVGLNLFIGSFRFKKPIVDLYKASWPFMLLLLFALMIITYIPAISLFWVQ